MYETLILRDILFYFLPGGFTLFGVGFLSWLQIPEHWKTSLSNYLPVNILILVAIFLAFSYVTGHILYIIHNATFGKLRQLKRQEIMCRFLQIKKDDKDVPEVIKELRNGLVNALMYRKQVSNKEKYLNSENLLQLYFTSDKYIFLKSRDLYTTYISRVTATSRFAGVMSVSWLIMALVCFSNFLTETIHFFWNTLLILTFILLSISFIKHSIREQEELVWNVIQATFLLNNEAIWNKQEALA